MATKKDPEISKADPIPDPTPDPTPDPIAVRVHPINVGQGDAILLEVNYEGN